MAIRHHLKSSPTDTANPGPIAEVHGIRPVRDGLYHTSLRCRSSWTQKAMMRVCPVMDVPTATGRAGILFCLQPAVHFRSSIPDLTSRDRRPLSVARANETACERLSASGRSGHRKHTCSYALSWRYCAPQFGQKNIRRCSQRFIGAPPLQATPRPSVLPLPDGLPCSIANR
jgi:hypothetical protein